MMFEKLIYLHQQSHLYLKFTIHFRFYYHFPGNRRSNMSDHGSTDLHDERAEDEAGQQQEDDEQHLLEEDVGEAGHGQEEERQHDDEGEEFDQSRDDQAEYEHVEEEEGEQHNQVTDESRDEEGSGGDGQQQEEGEFEEEDEGQGLNESRQTEESGEGRDEMDENQEEDENQQREESGEVRDEEDEGQELNESRQTEESGNDGHEDDENQVVDETQQVEGIGDGHEDGGGNEDDQNQIVDETHQQVDEQEENHQQEEEGNESNHLEESGEGHPAEGEEEVGYRPRAIGSPDEEEEFDDADLGLLEEGKEGGENEEDEEVNLPRTLGSPGDFDDETGEGAEEHGTEEGHHHHRRIIEDEDIGQEEQQEDEDASQKPEEVSQLMQNIFGEDDMSDDDEEGGPSARKDYEDEDEPKLIRIEQEEEDVEQDSLGRKWDFDVMLAKKKQERKRRRRKDGSIDLMADADDQIRALVEAMNEAANDDRVSNTDRRPAVKKRKMLPIVKSTLLKADLFEAMLDNGMISALSEWLAPLPDKSLPALEIRCTLLKILESWPNLEQSILKQSGLGRAVMYLFKHPKETKENKLIAAKLIREWSRPIFQLDSDFRSLSKEDRVQRDLSQMPLAKRRRLSVDDEGIPLFSSASKQKQARQDEGGPKEPGEAGFIPRARVPKPSTRDYVIRPKSEIEGRFRGETKNKQNSRFAKVQRQIRSQKVTKRAIGVSINKAVV